MVAGEPVPDTVGMELLAEAFTQRLVGVVTEPSVLIGAGALALSAATGLAGRFVLYLESLSGVGGSRGHRIS